MLRFKNADLRPVLSEALTNKCKVVLAKDQGVYMLSERGEQTPEGRRKLLAYAVGCNPDIDPFDDWWNLARTELGGDDFAEYLDPMDAVFQRVMGSQDDIHIRATPTHLTIEVHPAGKA